MVEKVRGCHEMTSSVPVRGLSVDSDPVNGGQVRMSSSYNPPWVPPTGNPCRARKSLLRLYHQFWTPQYEVQICMRMIPQTVLPRKYMLRREHEEVH